MKFSQFTGYIQIQCDWRNASDFVRPEICLIKYLLFVRSKFGIPSDRFMVYSKIEFYGILFDWNVHDPNKSFAILFYIHLIGNGSPWVNVHTTLIMRGNVWQTGCIDCRFIRVFTQSWIQSIERVELLTTSLNRLLISQETVKTNTLEKLYAGSEIN